MSGGGLDSRKPRLTIYFSLDVVIRSRFLKIRTLTNAQDWNALMDFAGEKKSPVGYVPFYDAAKAKGAPNSVLAHLIRKISDPRSRAEKFASIGLVNEAAEAAAATKDADLLTKIRAAAGTAGTTLASNFR